MSTEKGISITAVTDEDLANAVNHFNRDKYTKDGRKMIYYDEYGDSEYAEYKYDILNGTEIVCDGACSNCEYLERVYMPGTLKHIGAHAFHGCEALDNVNIPDSVESIGEFAFGYCPTLSKIEIPPKVSEIAEGLFYLCESLSSVTFQGQITSIGARAFEGCTKLRSFTIPASVTDISGNPFVSYHIVKHGSCQSINNDNSNGHE